MCKEMKMQIERSRKCRRKLDKKGISEKHFIAGQGRGVTLLKGAAARLLVRAEWNPKPQSDSQWLAIHAVEFVLSN
jgi:hypothetical protein